MLVDTGSHFTFLHPSVWNNFPDDIQDSLRPDSVPLYTATGEPITVYGVADVSFKFGKVEVSHPVRIADIATAGLIGMDLLIANESNIDPCRGQLKLHGVNVPVSVEHASELCCRIAVASTVTIPAGHEVIVPGKILRRTNTPKIGIVEPTQCFVEKDEELLIAGTVVDGTTDHVPLMMANLSTEPTVLYQGTHVALLQPASVPTELTSSEELESLHMELNELYKRSTSKLSEEKRKLVRKILLKYQEVFSKHGEPGRTSLAYHYIYTGDYPPLNQPPRRIPHHQRPEMEAQLQDMLEKGVITPSSSPWSSPIVLTTKKDGTTRCCVDFRRLNKVTRKDAYPLPRIDDSLDSLSGSEWFSTLDLTSGYWQVEVAPEDRHKTAFTAGPGSGLYQFNTMPFGLCNAPATFERLMERVLAGLQWQTCLVYLDDIIIFSKTFEDHLERMGTIFERLSGAGLKLKPKKCHLFQEKVLYLGHVVTKEGISTDPTKVDRVKDWPIPHSVKETRSFLGLCGYYRRFVKDFSKIASPLHRLTQKDSKFFWNSDCQTGFERLKNLLTTSPILTFPDFSLPFILDTDASGDGIGAVLSQVQNGKERVIAYGSKKLKKAERMYDVTKRELLAAVTFVKHFRHYLYGRKFLLRTDHASLRWLSNFKEVNAQLTRWFEALAMFDFDIEHRPGVRHGNADALSRRPEPKSPPTPKLKRKCCSVFQIPGWDKDHVRKEQIADKCLAPIMEALEKGTKPPKKDIMQYDKVTKALWMQWDQLSVDNGMLYRRFQQPSRPSFMQLVVPASLREEVLQKAHDERTAGHLGQFRTYRKVQRSYYWPNHRDHVSLWVSTCTLCQARKRPVGKRRRAKMRLAPVGNPIDRVAIDIFGPLPPSDSGNRYIIVIMDYFTKWAEAIAIPNQEAITVARAFVTQFVCRLGVPYKVHTDQGPNFESALFKEVFKLLGIEKTRTTPYRPQSDGMVERFMSTMASMVAMYVANDQTDWDEHLPFVLMAYRASVQKNHRCHTK